MQLIRGLSNLHLAPRGSVLTLGNFDAVHLGHQQILQQVREKAALNRAAAGVIVFEPQPEEFFNPNNAPPRLSNFREKLEQLTAAGAELVVCLRFNQQLASLSAEEFVEKILVKGLGVSHLVIGDDFKFGAKRQGDFKLLEELSHEYGYSLEATQTFELTSERVSSTRVRQALQANQFSQVAQLLGRPYKLSGQVMHGKKLGRKLGFPTANVYNGPYKRALQGAYCVLAQLPNGLLFPAMANLGFRPSVEVNQQNLLEVHLLGYNGDLYGKRLEVYPLKKLRDEHKFANVEALQQQLEEDKNQAINFFSQANSHWQLGEFWLEESWQPLLCND